MNKYIYIYIYIDTYIYVYLHMYIHMCWMVVIELVGGFKKNRFFFCCDLLNAPCCRGHSAPALTPRDCASGVMWCCWSAWPSQ